MKTCHHLMIAALAIGFVSTAGAASARADVTCTVVEVEASSGDAAAVDPELKPLEKKLKKPPFTSWNTFKRLGATQLKLSAQKVGTATLVHGKANVMLRDVIERAGKRPRVQLGVTLDDESGKRVIDTKVNVDAGDYFVAGRPLPANKGHLVALTCVMQ